MSGLNKYKRKVGQMLPCAAEEKKFVLAEIDRSLGNKANTMSYEDIVEQVGSPETLAASAIQDMEAEEIAAAMKTRNRMIRLIALLVAGILLVWAIGVTIALIDSTRHSGGYGVIGSLSTEIPSIYEEVM